MSSATSDLLIEVRLEGTTATDIGGPAVEASAEGVGVTDRDWDAFNPKLSEHLLDAELVLLYHDSVLIQHEYVHGEPF